MIDETRYLFLLSGVPGSGKSTLAQKLISGSGQGNIRKINEWCEADDWWYIYGHGKYAFNPKLLGTAHKWCQNKARSAMMKNENLIVSNTNLTVKDRGFYFDCAEECGYKVVFIHLDGGFKNIHDVPEETVGRMKEKYQSPCPYERELIVKKSEMNDGLKSLLESCNVNYEY